VKKKADPVKKKAGLVKTESEAGILLQQVQIHQEHTKGLAAVSGGAQHLT
jgi:hypothetical protein